MNADANRKIALASRPRWSPEFSASTGAACAASVERSVPTTRKLASRARSRVQGGHTVPDADPATQRQVVEAYLAASHDGDFEALVALLDPDVVLRADLGAGVSREARGAAAVADQVRAYSRLAPFTRLALINGAAGLIGSRDGQPFAVLAFTVRNGKITTLDVLADRERLGRLDLSALDD
jgi:ketosteroid isomerase-like protein